ncbi:MAG: hypothetical protein EOO50_02665 [Flavobacterium sp.]|uniref:sensor histidine kinase n=1 Tax=Flavobacterium sp. TaxID=239 RepID=UPI0011FA222B|nr:MEDS domain-containing protein [Flavobacterium sp.]RZJ68341.1 MAG: hypothetical protein EOO50_02665 [Flavobacterium sp.]
MRTTTTNSGINVLGDISWGSHFCTFYNSSEDLLDMMSSFFKAGLDNNELCVWVISEPLSVGEALLSIERDFSQLEVYLDKKQLLIVPYNEWYLDHGNFEAQFVLDRWINTYRQAIADGFSGMRANGIESWLTPETWEAFMAYEEALDKLITNKNIIIQCSYPLRKCSAKAFVDVAHVHEKVIACKKKKWHVLESQQVRESKAQLSEINYRLENLVKERTGNLEKAIRQLQEEATTRLKTERKLAGIARDLVQRNTDLQQFAYIVSHNVRGPVSNIMGIAGLLNDVQTTEERTLLGQNLFLAIGELDDVVRDLGEILKIKFQSADGKAKVVFQDMIDTILVSVGTLLQKEHVTFRVDFSEVPSIFTSRSYMYSIFMNLIGNSLKYKHPDRDPEISIQSRLSGNNVQLIFIDNGIGIDLNRHGSKLFGLYQRFHSNTDGSKGLGLFMVKTQAEALGGTVSVTSEVGQGTRFVLEFPIVGENV